MTCVSRLCSSTPSSFIILYQWIYRSELKVELFCLWLKSPSVAPHTLVAAVHMRRLRLRAVKKRVHGKTRSGVDRSSRPGPSDDVKLILSLLYKMRQNSELPSTRTSALKDVQEGETSSGWQSLLEKRPALSTILTRWAAAGEAEEKDQGIWKGDSMGCWQDDFRGKGGQPGGCWRLPPGSTGEARWKRGGQGLNVNGGLQTSAYRKRAGILNMGRWGRPVSLKDEWSWTTRTGGLGRGRPVRWDSRQAIISEVQGLEKETWRHPKDE